MLAVTCDTCASCDSHPTSQRHAQPGSTPPTHISQGKGCPWLASKETQRQSKVGGHWGGHHDFNVLTQKGAGNLLESGFKAVVWSLVVTAVAGATAVTTKKDLMQCKTCYHWYVIFSHFSHWLISQAFLQLKVNTRQLRLSGVFLAMTGQRGSDGHSPLGCLGLICQGNVLDASVTCFWHWLPHLQSHEKARKFMKKPFPLYDDLMNFAMPSLWQVLGHSGDSGYVTICSQC